MAARKRSGMPKTMKLAEMAREKAEKPPKVSTKLPKLPVGKQPKAPRVTGTRTPSKRLAKFPKPPAIKPARHKKG